MTNKQVEEMKSSWKPEHIKIFFDAALSIFKPLMSSPRGLDPLHGQVLYYCSILFVGGLIHSMSKEAQKKIYRKATDLLYSCKFKDGMYVYPAIKVHMSILKYEEDRIKEGGSYMQSKIIQREKEIERLKSF